MTKRVTIIEVKDYVGQEVTIGAWVANKSGKGKIAFLQLRDGTAFFQGVAFKAEDQAEKDEDGDAAPDIAPNAGAALFLVGGEEDFAQGVAFPVVDGCGG